MAHDVGERAREHAHLAVEGLQAAERLAVDPGAVLGDGPAVAVLHDPGIGRIRRQRRRQHDRTGARPAAAVRRREGLVQVDVHAVDAEIARPHAADDGVEVGAVAVEVGARRVHGLGRSRRSRVSNRPQVFGLVSMIAATSGPSAALSAARSTRPLSLAGIGFTVKPSAAAVAGLVPCADSGASTRAPLGALALGFEGGGDRHHAAHLAMRAGGGRHRHGRHAGQGLEPVRQAIDQLQRALHGRDRLQRMEVADAGEARHLLVDARIVLHGARAQRVDAHVDGVVLLAEPRVVLHDLRLGQARQADLAGAAQAVEAILRPSAAPAGRRRSVPAGPSRRSAAPRSAARGCR